MSSSAPGRLLRISLVFRKNMVQRTVVDDQGSWVIIINEIRRTCDIGASKTMMWEVLNKSQDIVRSRMGKCPQLTQKHKDETFNSIF
uniref:HTH_48 domain-containing protein n=1 Tax=Heterorhabditis bacteriophora TaxID=37862 RepID=A0A1I7X586_HETBA